MLERHPETKLKCTVDHHFAIFLPMKEYVKKLLKKFILFFFRRLIIFFMPQKAEFCRSTFFGTSKKPGTFSHGREKCIPFPSGILRLNRDIIVSGSGKRPYYPLWNDNFCMIIWAFSKGHSKCPDCDLVIDPIASSYRSIDLVTPFVFMGQGYGVYNSLFDKWLSHRRLCTSSISGFFATLRSLIIVCLNVNTLHKKLEWACCWKSDWWFF